MLWERLKLIPYRIDHSWQDICTLALTSIYSLYTQIAKDGYKIVEFGPGSCGIDGRILDPILPRLKH
ncbi:uncharacterized protein BDCG_08744 [Blastomyces dermatitidis ER-3]|uniref:Uncharacterized protein n=1 Tax=Ajellomyces dermatitidis (strain ER-3 / ATCC MYA-2586) TaxID=559297 RepID=A0ABP2EPL9_AJEDR|nr:uncharacterized protein BDCG_08744 [Blastomyces dermatitidis ER-3]EEQ85475.2 hypothetical protein BDCG_08744 [Blastomyces dermatitidis ER-3]